VLIGFMKKTLLFILLLLPFSCKKEDTPVTPTPIPATGFQLSKTMAMPLEVLTVIFDEPLDKKTLDAKIGTVPVVWQQVDSKTYGFMVPETVAPGTYEVAILNNSKTVSLTVKAAAAIPDPAGYTQTFLQEAGLQVERMKVLQDSLIKQNILKKENSDSELKAIRTQIDEAKRQFDALSEKDKLLCVKYIAANRTALDSLNLLIANYRASVPLPGGRLRANCPNFPRDEYIDCLLPRLSVFCAVAGVSIAGFALGLKVPDVNFKVGILLLSAGGLFLSVTELRDLISIDFALPSIFTGDTPTLSPQNLPTLQEYKAAVAQKFKFSFPLRNIQLIDRNSVKQKVKEAVNAILDLQAKVDQLKPMLPTLSITFPPPNVSVLWAEVASKLSVTVLNNPNVTGTISNFNKGLFDLTFTTTQKTNQTFDYKITYQFGDTPVEKTITSSQLTVSPGSVDLSDCGIITANGVPIIKAGEAGKEYTFSIAGSCKFPPKTLFSWNFGDGTPDVVDVDNLTARHTFKTAGQYAVKLRVLLDNQLDYLNFTTTAQVGPAASDYYFTYQANGTTYNLETVYAHVLGGRFDIVGDGNKIQAGIFFSPASLVGKGASANKFAYHCTPTADRPDRYVLGSHLFDFNTQKPIATTYSRGAIWGCDTSQPADNETPGHLIIFQNDGTLIEGTFEYTDYVTKLPVSGKFKVPIRQ
jgi:hypothetical protein